jgi:hypothetical protein
MTLSFFVIFISFPLIAPFFVHRVSLFKVSGDKRVTRFGEFSTTCVVWAAFLVDRSIPNFLATFSKVKVTFKLFTGHNFGPHFGRLFSQEHPVALVVSAARLVSCSFADLESCLFAFGKRKKIVDANQTFFSTDIRKSFEKNKQTFLLIHSGLPEGIFSTPKSQFG